ncbi:helix-turn-helix domain-containing protein [Micromonospora sp. WMMA1998]|uniref:helix-turn-helix domain-containing protein n=1 Tax=Micromonospora sp. WMMA1998 TaxID=3015167 RepID=UPI00248AA3A4|nr:helix-turn-helix domain-containing protein [Micromonospora sp. WMMA1998]WBC17989.1 helix-turn-helix domain-containing protein [Micromonospora sp. WMMA1998]
MHRFSGPRGLHEFRRAVRQSLVSQAVEARDPAGFRARLSTADVGPTRLVSVSAGALHARRQTGRRSSGGVFLLLSTKADGRIRHRFGVEPVVPGRLVVVPGGEPFEVDYSAAAKLLFVVLPPVLVEARYAALDAAIRSAPLDPVGRALGRQLPHLMTAAGATEDPARRRDLASVFAVVLDLLLDGTLGDTRGGPHLALRLAAERLVEDHLTEPDLSVAWLASQLAVSVRQLHRAFADNGHGPAGYIRLRRLQACARDLVGSPMSASELAYRYQFASASHFGAAFRAHFGSSPGRWRAKAAADGHGFDSVAARL